MALKMISKIYILSLKRFDYFFVFTKEIAVNHFQFTNIARFRFFESFAVAILVFLFFLLVTFSGQAAKRFLANVLILVLGHIKYFSVKIVTQVVIRDTCGT